MCGIAGFVDFRHQSNVENLQKMTDVLFHRGPDDGGYFFEGLEQSQVGLGHRRLSILDLSNYGHQPMEFSNLTIVYNGEVYNFKEIRADLIKQGYSFESHTDTEVILKAYHKWGIEAVHRFNGMFTIAIFDNQKQTLTLIRDRAGVKPLYWYQKDGLFMFASELKSFHEHPAFVKELNHDGLTLFLQYGYIPQPHTIFKHTYKLKAGHVLELDTKSAQSNIRKYWDVIDCYNQPKLNISEQEAIDETERLLKSACEYRMVADVPVGIFLSGGYDSSTVAAIIQSGKLDKVKTFTIGFEDENLNEANEARSIADFLGTDHHELICSNKEAIKILETLPFIFDEPFSDSSSIPTVLVSQFAKEYVTVSLSADGGDELFGGYSKYKNINKYFSKFEGLPFKEYLDLPLTIFQNSNFVNSRNKQKIDIISRIIKSKSAIDALGKYQEFFNLSDINELLVNFTGSKNTSFSSNLQQNQHLTMLNELMAIDFKTYQLDDILVKVDRATMSVGLEGREPLLDINLINFITQVDDKLKFKNGSQKYLLKSIAHKYITKDLLDRPKKGFGAPIEKLLATSMPSLLENYFSQEFILNQGIFNENEINSLLNKYRKGNTLLFPKIWNLLTFQIWYGYWMK